MSLKKLNTKDHRNRKSPGSAELWRKEKKARNAARGKQVRETDPVTGVDEWVRIIVDSPGSLTN
jgi:hypothetical protein